MNGARQKTVLVHVTSHRAARIARTVVASLAPRFDFFLLLSSPAQLGSLEALGHPHGFDMQSCMLSPERFALVLGFESSRSDARGSAPWLARYFERIGIPTIEVQTQLFQRGFWPVSTTVDASAREMDGPSDDDVPSYYAARELLTWGGEGGIGYPGPPGDGFESAIQENLVGVTSALDQPSFSERDRYAFIIAVLRFARAHPELSFAWAVRPEEQLSAQAAKGLEMVADHDLPNLWLEFGEGTHPIAERCAWGISMATTDLLDYERAGKPVLIQRGPFEPALARYQGGPSFANFLELERLFAEMRRRTSSFKTNLRAPLLDVELLAQRINAAVRRRALASDWQSTALPYLSYLEVLESGERAGDAPPMHREALDSGTAARISQKLESVTAKLGVIQRSTLSYKALKLMRMLKSRA